MTVAGAIIMVVVGAIGTAVAAVGAITPATPACVERSNRLAKHAIQIKRWATSGAVYKRR